MSRRWESESLIWRLEEADGDDVTLSAGHKPTMGTMGELSAVRMGMCPIVVVTLPLLGMGDGTSVELMNDARRTRRSGSRSSDRHASPPHGDALSEEPPAAVGALIDSRTMSPSARRSPMLSV